MERVELRVLAKNFNAIKAVSNYVDSVYLGSEEIKIRMLSKND